LSKCYIADSDGSKSGLKKGSVYIEKSILDVLINKLDCKFEGEYLVLLQDLRAEIKEVSLYESFSDCISLNKHTQLEAKFDRDRTSWIKLGETVIIEKNNLKLELIEIVLYSPHDETAFFYFDTLRGNMHGITTNVFHDMFPFGGFPSDLEFRYANKNDIEKMNNILLNLT
jgi:ASC-1-like (ASCH) protein